MERRRLLIVFLIIFTIGIGNGELPGYPSKSSDCFSGLTSIMAQNAVKFYQDVARSGNWEEWGIDENERSLKIWIIPPAVGFEKSLEIIQKSAKNEARLHLLSLIENSFGKKIGEAIGHSTKIQVIGNSKKTINELVGLMTEKYSRKVFEDDVHREIGLLTKANVLMKIFIIPGAKPIMTAHFLSIEKGIKFDFSGNIKIDLSRCTHAVKRQFEKLAGYYDKTVGSLKERIIIDYLPCRNFKGQATTFTEQVFTQFLSILTSDGEVRGNDNRVVKQEEKAMIKIARKLKKKLAHKFELGQQVDSKINWLRQKRFNSNRLLMVCKVGDKVGGIVNKIFFSVELISSDARAAGSFAAEWYKLY
jgi:hypothetical protein